MPLHFASILCGLVDNLHGYVVGNLRLWNVLVDRLAADRVAMV